MRYRERCQALSSRSLIPFQSLVGFGKTPGAKLKDAKLVIEHFGFQVDGSDIQTGNETVVEQARLSDKLTVLVNDIGIAMKKLGYVLYAGKVYKKCDKARYTYWYKCQVEAFVKTLAANQSFKARLLKDMKKVI